MIESILETIKKLLGIDKTYKQFDDDIVVAINSAFMSLNQLGVGPEEGFRIEGSDESWDDYISDTLKLEAVKSYVHLKTKLLFDPPQSGVVMECYNRQISELEWRLNVSVDTEREV